MDKKISSKKITNRKEGAVLSKLWFKILEETDLINAIVPLINRYTNKANSMKAVKTKTKSSLTKNIYSHDMTWRVFLDLMFNFINVKKMEFSVKVTHPNGDVTLHVVPITNNDISSDEEEEDER